MKVLFIIPKTPKKFSSDFREELFLLTIESLLKQTFRSWNALIVTDDEKLKFKDDRLIVVNSFVLSKKEKIDVAIERIWPIRSNYQYVVRLDDDDIISSTILEDISRKKKFDVYLDLWQSFYHYETGGIAQSVFSFPANSVIIKTSVAFSNFNYDGDGPRYMINNQHNNYLFCPKINNIKVSRRNAPIYVRTVTSSSITAGQSHDRHEYLNWFGTWKYRVKLAGFSFKRESTPRITQSCAYKVWRVYRNYRVLINWLVRS